MTAAAWAAYALIAGAALGLTFWLYLRREPPGRGRVLLATLRSAALAIVLLLLFDPAQLGRSAPAEGRAPRVLLDASASMALPRAPDERDSRWSAAVARARQRAGNRPVLLFGAAVRPVPPESLGVAPPGDTRSSVLPALRVAAEAGARSVLVLTDGALEDAAALPGWLARLGLQVRWELVGSPLPGAGLQEVSAPAWAAAGEAFEVDAAVAWAAPDPRPRRLLVRQEGRVIAEAELPGGTPGRVNRVRVSVRPTAPPDGGTVRLDVALEPPDALPADDHRAVMLDISAEPAGIVLVSGRPDWEPRFLLPVLQRALGLPAHGFLQIAPGVWTRLDGGVAAGRRVPEADVARAASRADLLVLHAPPAAPLPWLTRAARSARRLLVLAVREGDVSDLPLRPEALIEDDWFLVEPVPASPVAALLADVQLAEAPPLAALLPAQAVGAWSPLQVAAGRRGRTLPALLAGQEAGRRWAVALGQGYWRWAFHGGEPRRLYEHLWSAVAGWLAGEGPGAGAAAVRPAYRVLPRGSASEWLAAGLRPDSIRLQARHGAGALLVDTVLVRAVGDTLMGPVLAPGPWRYQATAYAGAASARGAGELFVEEYAPELARPTVRLTDVRAAEGVGGAPGARGAARPLRESPVPWILVVLLLATEWVLRRRWGLR
ncbi:MAG TPA: hypothetical protein VK939_10000 [Longimicrobiales bacterium]|nr:hypothetical protein [Longimicrobiales bacterium]